MNNLVKLTWKNTIIVMVLFYLIGDLYKTTIVMVNKGVKNYQVYRENKEYQEYLQSDEYKLKELDGDIERTKIRLESAKSYYEMEKGLEIYSKKELEEEKQEIASTQKKLDSLINLKNNFKTK